MPRANHTVCGQPQPQGGSCQNMKSAMSVMCRRCRRQQGLVRDPWRIGDYTKSSMKRNGAVPSQAPGANGCLPGLAHYWDLDDDCWGVCRYCGAQGSHKSVEIR